MTFLLFVIETVVVRRHSFILLIELIYFIFLTVWLGNLNLLPSLRNIVTLLHPIFLPTLHVFVFLMVLVLFVLKLLVFSVIRLFLFLSLFVYSSDANQSNQSHNTTSPLFFRHNNCKMWRIKRKQRQIAYLVPIRDARLALVN